MAAKNRSHHALSDVLHLYTTRSDDPLTFTYEIECATFSAISFTLNFEGSENFQIIATAGSVDGTKLVAKVRPYTRIELGKVSLIDDDRRASLKTKCSWLVEDPDESEISEYMKVHLAQLDRVLQEAKNLDFPHHSTDPKNSRVKEICQTYGKNFVDFDFPPRETSLYRPGSLAEQSAGKEKKLQVVEWKRPVDFMKGRINIFEGSIEAADIRQGALGDCWFLSALAALTEFPILIREGVFTEESREANEQGCYNIRFCKMGIWQTVRVDDFFPCYPGGGPIYSRSNGDELWVLLAEKAYAKIHGSYEAIRAGFAYEGMIDLTGCPSRNIRFDLPETKAKIASGALWRELCHYDEENFLMSASTPGEDHLTESGRFAKSPTGLIAGHAYTLISAVQLDCGHRLLRLRNPWGQMEWSGDWSDTSSMWNEAIKDEIKSKLDNVDFTNADDGVFWMSFEDVLKHFVSINVCLVRHPGLNRYPWTDVRCLFHYDLEEVSSSSDDAVSSSTSAVGKSHEVFGYRVVNPMFLMQVSDKCQCVATVHQQDTRIEGALPYIDIGVSILKADPTYGTFTLVAGSGNCTDRQHGTEEITLEPGKYLVIPTTSGAKLKQSIESRRLSDEARQLPRGKPRVPLTIRRAGGTEVEFSDAVINAYTELFTRMDCDHDGFLSKVEIDQYMLRTEGAAIEEAAFQWLVNTFEPSVSQTLVNGSTGHSSSLGLSLPAFLRAQIHVFRTGGQDEDKLWQEMRLLGYNEDLQLVNCRAASVVVHCTTSNFNLEAIPHDEHAALEAQELVVKHLGEVSTFEDGKIKLYKHRTGTGGVTLMVENNHFISLVFALDCTQSENVISHRGDLVHEETIAPNKRVIMHVLMPEKAQDSWAWAYSASYMWVD